jgi:hypothetical protein
MNNTIRQRTRQEKRKIYKAIDSISGVASKFSIMMNTRQNDDCNGAQGTTFPL